ncbi:hypothetical protein D3C87_1935270 [compost metagenome]
MLFGELQPLVAGIRSESHIEDVVYQISWLCVLEDLEPHVYRRAAEVELLEVEPSVLGNLLRVITRRIKVRENGSEVGDLGRAPVAHLLSSRLVPARQAISIPRV